MPIYPGMNERISWYLPLVGGAEMNRLKAPQIVYFTSMPYPYIHTDAIGVAATDARFPPSYVLVEGQTIGLQIVGGAAEGTIYSEYKNYAPEGVGIGTTVTAGSAVTTIYSEYKNYAPEGVGISAGVVGGSAYYGLITYSNYEPEAMAVGARITGGTAS